MKLIDKDALVAEIDKTYKFHFKRGNEHDSSICDVLYGLSHRIGTLEVKEVDLEKEISFRWSWFCIHDKDRESFVKVAKHFFELGLKATQKEEIYVVTRSEEHSDYVEAVFLSENKAEEYCNPFNEDENCYARHITKVKIQ